MDVKEKCVIITGGASGIAEAAVKAFIQAGANVVSLDVNDKDGQRVVDEINKAGPGKAYYLHCDISNKSEVDAVFAEAYRLMGKVDVLVNSAALDKWGPAETYTEEMIDLILNVNLKGTIYTNQAAFTYMKAGGGKIINFTSCTGIDPCPNGALYSASKGGVVSWNRSVAHEWGKYGISVNCIAPAIWTHMYEGWRAQQTPEQLVAHDENQKRVMPLGGKLGDPIKDIAPVLLFLASEASCFITGQIIPVDGGMMSTR